MPDGEPEDRLHAEPRTDHGMTECRSQRQPPGFLTPTGTRVRLLNWRHEVWQPAIKKSSLPDNVTPYVVRHTAASLMAQQGVPVSTAAASLGHDPAVYLRTYAHLYPGDLRSAADAMDAARSPAARTRTSQRDRAPSPPGDSTPA